MSQPLHRLVETTPPASEPISLSETKTFLRVDHDNDDTLITSLITAARQLCESVTGRSLITCSYSLYLDAWPVLGGMGWWDGVREGADTAEYSTTLDLPRPPLISVAQINVYAADNTSAAFSSGNYFVDTAGVPGRIVLKQGAVPPVPGRVANGIEVQFQAGYGASASNVPAALRQGMKQIVAHLYENRGDTPMQALLQSGATSIFQAFRLVKLA